jgi:hypothetical protein
VIGLVACSKSKLDRPAPARELYTSPLFKLSLAYAKAHCRTVFAISAEHGLVPLDRVLAPYDTTLADLSPARRSLWGQGVVASVLLRLYADDSRLMIFAGDSYVEPIDAALRGTAEIVEPLHGMQIGERLSFLNAQLGRRAA